MLGFSVFTVFALEASLVGFKYILSSVVFSVFMTIVVVLYLDMQMLSTVLSIIGYLSIIGSVLFLILHGLLLLTFSDVFISIAVFLHLCTIVILFIDTGTNYNIDEYCNILRTTINIDYITIDLKLLYTIISTLLQ